MKVTARAEHMTLEQDRRISEVVERERSRLRNWLMPPIFGWREITFWQAFGLLALCRILFGGSGWHGSGRSNVRRRMEERMEERCAQMTPEERERFRQRMGGRWDFGPFGGERKEK